MRELVALDLPGGDVFVDALRRAWDAGDAVLPVDQRLSTEARQAVLDHARPHAVIGGSRFERFTYDPDAPPVDDDDAVVVPTSGSTGSPKFVVHTFASLSAHARAVHLRLDVDPSRDRWLCCLPLVHLGGLGVVVRSIITETGLDVLAGFDAAAVERSASELGATLVSLVPTALDRLDPTPFRWVVVGGAADRPSRPANVVRTYGLTETGGGVVYDGIALDGVELALRVVDPGDGGTGDDLDLDVGDAGTGPSPPIGQVAVRSATTSRGTRGQDGSVEALVDEDGWLVTEDLGHWSDDGRLVVDGRADDLIVSGGENVWPEPVELVLRSHPGVMDVAIVGRPDPNWGHRVVAAVVPTNPAWPPSLDELRGYVTDRLSPIQAPRELVVLESLPHTALGKVRRPKLESYQTE